jgi:DNA-binding transcriptional MerR regulator
MSTRDIFIGAVARKTGLTVPTVRYYEEVGLLPPQPRTEAGQRHYSDAAVRRLTFIRRCRDFGFSIESVKELVGLVDRPERPCMEVRDIAATQLQQVKDKLQELLALEQSLAAFVANCDGACAGGPAVDCSILEDLGAPARKPPAALTNGGCCGGR